MQGPRQRCPFCRIDLTALLRAPELPDYGVRPGPTAGQWGYSSRPPLKEERISSMAYECSDCEATFVVVLPTALD